MNGINDLTWLNDIEKLPKEKLAKILINCIKNDLLVYMGTGSGNNTMAEIIAVADPDEMEFVYIMDSNFGSDD